MAADPDGADDGFFVAYDRTRQRISDLVGAPGVDRAAPVPACPGWTVGDVVAHLAGLAVDVVAGDTAHYGDPAWTAAQVQARTGVALADLSAEWAGVMSELALATLPAQVRAFGTIGHLVFVDAAIHEHDLRGALGAPDPLNEAARLGLDSSVALLRRLLRRVQAAGAPPLHVGAADGRRWRIAPEGDEDAHGPTAVGGAGADASAVHVSGPGFELWRGLTGRRTRDQIRALAWVGDPEPYLDRWTLGPLPFADTPLDY